MPGRNIEREEVTQDAEGVTVTTNNGGAGTGSVTGQAIDANQAEFRFDELTNIRAPSNVDVFPTNSSGGYSATCEEIRDADGRYNVAVLAFYEDSGAAGPMQAVAGSTSIDANLQAEGFVNGR